MRAEFSFPIQAVELPPGPVSLGSPDGDFIAAQRGDPTAQERMRLNRDLLSFFENGGSGADTSTKEAQALTRRCAKLRGLGSDERPDAFASLGFFARSLRKLVPGAMRCVD